MDHVYVIGMGCGGVFDVIGFFSIYGKPGKGSGSV